MHDLSALGWRHRRHYDMRATFWTSSRHLSAGPLRVVLAVAVAVAAGEPHRRHQLRGDGPVELLGDSARRFGDARHGLIVRT